MHEVCFEGQWWLPEDKQTRKVYGKLVFDSENGLHLNTKDAIRQIGPSGPDLWSQHSIIYGTMNDGTRITLCKTRRVGVSGPGDGIFSEEYICECAFIGSHWNALEDNRFGSASVAFSHLRDWIQWRGYQQVPTKHLPILQARVGFIFVQRDTVTIPTKRGEIKITIQPNVPHYLRKGIHLTESVRIHILPGEELTLDEWLNRYINPLLFLMTLATDRPNYITGIYLPRKDFGYSEIRALCRGYHFGAEPEKYLPDKQMLFTYEDVSHNLGKMMDDWFTTVDELDSVVDLFFLSRYTQMRPKQRFVCLVQALESYHRRKTANPSSSEEKCKKEASEREYRKRVERILAKVDDEDEDWLKEILHWANEPSLLQRLTELMTVHKEVVEPIVLDVDVFVTKVKDTRNYLTHYKTNLLKKAASGVELHGINQVLDFLLKACLLAELGFTPKERLALFHRNSEYQRAKELVKAAQPQ